MYYERKVGSSGRQSWFAFRDDESIGEKREYLRYNYEELLIVQLIDEGGYNGLE